MTKNFRNMIDITPWDKSGYSFWGLNREQAKNLGLALVILGLILMSPPCFPDPSDLLNIFVSKYLVEWFGMVPQSALVFTYTFLAWSIFLLGIYIYPYNTERLFNSYISKFKRWFGKIINRPPVLIAILIAGYLTFKWYQSILIGFI